MVASSNIDFLKIIPSQIISSVDMTTSPFLVSTDLQAPFMALMATSNGISKIKETVFENRMHHVNELIAWVPILRYKIILQQSSE